MCVSSSDGFKALLLRFYARCPSPVDFLVCVPCPVPSPGIVCDSLFWWLVVQRVAFASSAITSFVALNPSRLPGASSRRTSRISLPCCSAGVCSRELRMASRGLPSHRFVHVKPFSSKKKKKEDGIENGETRRDSGKRRKCPSPKQDLPCGTPRGHPAQGDLRTHRI